MGYRVSASRPLWVRGASSFLQRHIAIPPIRPLRHLADTLRESVRGGCRVLKSVIEPGMALAYLVHLLLCRHNHTFCFRVMTTRAAEAARMLAENAPRATTFTAIHNYINTFAGR